MLLELVLQKACKKEGIFMAEKSLLDLAFDVLSESNKPIAFKTLFEKVAALAKLDLSDAEMKTRMSKFYTQLTLDGRFAVLTDNKWDLSKRYKYDDCHKEVEDAYSDEDEVEEYDPEEAALLAKEESGEIDEEMDNESDDIDFDKPKTNNEEENF